MCRTVNEKRPTISLHSAKGVKKNFNYTPEKFQNLQSPVTCYEKARTGEQDIPVRNTERKRDIK